MSLPVCALAGSPAMFFYTLMVLVAPMVLAQCFRNFYAPELIE